MSAAHKDCHHKEYYDKYMRTKNEGISKIGLGRPESKPAEISMFLSMKQEYVRQSSALPNT